MSSPKGTSLSAPPKRFRLFGDDVQIASVDDLIRMKRAAGRPKDLLAVEELGALRSVLDEAGDSGG